MSSDLVGTGQLKFMDTPGRRCCMAAVVDGVEIATLTPTCSMYYVLERKGMPPRLVDRDSDFDDPGLRGWLAVAGPAEDWEDDGEDLPDLRLGEVVVVDDGSTGITFQLSTTNDAGEAVMLNLNAAAARDLRAWLANWRDCRGWRRR